MLSYSSSTSSSTADIIIRLLCHPLLRHWRLRRSRLSSGIIIAGGVLGARAAWSPALGQRRADQGLHQSSHGSSCEAARALRGAAVAGDGSSSLRDSASHAGQGAQSVPVASPSRTRRREAGPSLPHATRRRRTSDMIICQGAEKLGAGGEGAAGGGGRRTAAFVFRFGRPRRTHRSRRVGVDVSASLFLSDHRRQPHCHARCHRAGMGKATHRRAFCGSLRDDSVADFAARSRLPPGSAPLPHKQRDGCHRV